MRYVILRDDDTNALTPIECLEALYKPIIEKKLPVNLATIPCVSIDAKRHDGLQENFLVGDLNRYHSTVPIGDNPQLVKYLKQSPTFRIVQHGLHHKMNELFNRDRDALRQMYQDGLKHLQQAGFPRPTTLVAPYDMFSKEALIEGSRLFPVISTGWYQKERLPLYWWPRYALKKFKGHCHWSIGNTTFLTHPGCILSHDYPLNQILNEVKKVIEGKQYQLTVLVTHWWECFYSKDNIKFIDVFHDVLRYLMEHPDIKIISFDDLARDKTIKIN